MADDGMLLNFAAPLPGQWEAKPVFKGGNWKDRLTAKKSAAYGAQKRREREAGIEGEQDKDKDQAEVSANRVPINRNRITRPSNTNDRPVKRRKTDDSEQRTPGTGGQGERDLIRQAQNQARYASRPQGPKRVPKEVVSSLFTFNPSANAADSAQTDTAKEEEAEAVEASNAPLSPELENFTTLGLSKSLALHLLNKMDIKAPTVIQRKAVAQLLKDDSDAFVQAETGSGKTLAYLLPLVQRLINLSESLKASTGNKMGRDSGLFAIVLAPTRELSKQIETVLEALLGAARYIVGGTVIGGEKKKSEKARLRKGFNILVATPGRLADHLNNTEALDVSRVRWLVLDEGDRLMELGFEQDIQKIVSTLNLRMRATAQKDDGILELLPTKRTTVLCSATIKMDVQRLGEISLKDAAHIASDKKQETNEGADGDDAEKGFQAPSQLKQSCAVVPAKQRLVSLVALLRRTFSRKGATMKAIVFLSCADSVDFHFELLTRSEKQSSEPTPVEEPQSYQGWKGKPTGKIAQGTLLPETRTSGASECLSHPTNPVSVFRLHGSLPQNIRTLALQSFSKSTTASVLVCTDVASRGLDLPNIDLVIEYDPAFSRDDHLHRIGRTARAGRDGRALVFLMPGCEEGYLSVLKQDRRTGSTVARHEATEILRRGFAATSGVITNERLWEEKATEFQLDVERWALEDSRVLEAARRAFQSHVRAYATHIAAERGFFDIKQLHLGHLCKAFGLRDRPGSIKVPGLRQGRDEVKRARDQNGRGGSRNDGGGDGNDQQPTDVTDAKRKMREKMRAMGGASEFNLG